MSLSKFNDYNNNNNSGKHNLYIRKTEWGSGHYFSLKLRASVLLYVGMLQKSVQVNRKILATPTVHCTVSKLFTLQYNLQCTVYTVHCTNRTVYIYLVRVHLTNKCCPSTVYIALYSVNLYSV